MLLLYRARTAGGEATVTEWAAAGGVGEEGCNNSSQPLATMADALRSSSLHSEVSRCSLRNHAVTIIF